MRRAEPGQAGARGLRAEEAQESRVVREPLLGLAEGMHQKDRRGGREALGLNECADGPVQELVADMAWQIAGQAQPVLEKLQAGALARAHFLGPFT